ncbi:Uncharacterised protein [Klebsiella variicola]|nr:Uncharacterised protein [Klebsiella variicola]
MGTAQSIRSLTLLPCFTSWSYRPGAEYTVRNDLIALLCTAILTSLLIDLHITRHADKVSFMVFGQRIGLLTKGNDTQPESNLSVICRITGKSYRQAGHSHVRTFSRSSGLRVGHQSAIR